MTTLTNLMQSLTVATFGEVMGKIIKTGLFLTYVIVELLGAFFGVPPVVLYCWIIRWVSYQYHE